MGFISKVELKYQLRKMGIKIEGNYVLKKDVAKVLAAVDPIAKKFIDAMGGTKYNIFYHDYDGISSLGIQSWYAIEIPAPSHLKEKQNKMYAYHTASNKDFDYYQIEIDLPIDEAEKADPHSILQQLESFKNKLIVKYSAKAVPYYMWQDYPMGNKTYR